MSTSRSYTSSVSFPSGVNPYELQEDITGLSVNPTHTDEDITADTLTIYFDGALTAGDETALDAIVAAYVYEAPISEITKSLSILNHTVNTTDYLLVASMVYLGSFNEPELEGFYFASSTSAKITSHDLLITNPTADPPTTLAEVNFTNLELVVHKVDNLANVPKKMSTLEIYVKKTGGTTDDNVEINLIQAIF